MILIPFYALVLPSTVAIVLGIIAATCYVGQNQVIPFVNALADSLHKVLDAARDLRSYRRGE